MKFLTLAYNTHREAIRDKILAVILVFAILMIAASILLSYLSLNQQDKIVIDLGLSTINAFGLVITIFIGTTLLNKEIERKTIYLLLPKPLYRAEFILGKYFGLCWTVGVITLAMALAFYGVFWYTTHDIMRVVGILTISGQAILLIYAELMLLIAFAVFFSSFASSIMSAIFTLGMYVIGHLTQDIVNFGKLSGQPGMAALSKVIYYILPDLERLNLKNHVMFSQGVSLDVFAASIGYGLLYSTALLVLSMIIFESREF